VSRLHLTLAISEYDHTRDVCSGVVAVDGVDLTHLSLPIEEMHFRFTKFREWDVSEMSLGKYVSLLSQDDRSMVAIPVFPNRAFRHSAFYVRRDSELTDPRQLAGKRVGVPEWAQTAGIFARGILTDQYGVRLPAIEWWQAGVNEPGRIEKVELRLPDGVRIRPAPNTTLSAMLTAGELDAVISAHPPEPFKQGDPTIVQLFHDVRAVEEAYWRTTGIFPIMHIIAIRREIFDRHRWVAMNLYKAFDAARRRSLHRISELTASRVPVPWLADYVERWRPLFGPDYWPYGLDANRTTLEAFCRYAFEQGVCHRRVAADELFPPEVLNTFRI
jgi:4,5-dihydroxyphthalate decarboxylase